MSQVEKLNGGLDSRRDDENSEALESARKRLASQNNMSLDFLKGMPSGQEADDGRIDVAEAATYINDIADKGYKWITDHARPFLRNLERQIKEIGNEVLADLCDDGTQLNDERQRDYETGIEFLLAYGPDQDDVIREELDNFPQRRGMFEKLFHRINDVAHVALLADDLRYAESKNQLEQLLQTVKYGPAKNSQKVFVKTSDQKSPNRAFGKVYELTDGVFGHYHDFAVEKFAEAITSRSRELATAHKVEVKQQKMEVSAKAETDVSPEQLLFGDPDEVNEKTALLTWTFQGHQNAIRVRLAGDRLYVIDAIGKPKEALEKVQEELDEPFVSLDYILDKDREHLCLGEMQDGKLKYKFGGFVKREIFPLVCWVRTAAGMCLPDRLLKEDETQTVISDKTAKNGKKPNGKQAVALVDNDGKETVNPDVFYFRTVNSGAGTITVNLPEGFVLYLDEVKNEEQETIAPAREVKLTNPVIVKIRRLIVDGKMKIVLDSCDDVAVMQDLQANGIPKVEWTETGKKGWSGLPSPLPGILSFRYKLACESGELKPNTKR